MGQGGGSCLVGLVVRVEPSTESYLGLIMMGIWGAEGLICVNPGGPGKPGGADRAL